MLRRVLRGRTTFLITHRLSQIRWADQILVLDQGKLVDKGTHDELLARCEAYRHIFGHYESALPVSRASKSELVLPSPAGRGSG